ncbi:hypothetical protein Tco_0277500 [Tanacetum coccineum]
MGIRHAKPHTLRGVVFDETRTEVRLGQVKTYVLPLYQGFPAKVDIVMDMYLRLSTALQSSIHPQILRSPSNLGCAHMCTISDAIRGTATISPVKTKSITTKPLNLFFWHDKRERRNTSNGTPENTPLTNHASTLANPGPAISPAFIEANYEVLESLLREGRRQMCNEDLRSELEYYSKEYDEEKEMEPRLARVRKTTIVL